MKLPELEELYRRYRMDLYRYLCFFDPRPCAGGRPVERNLCAGHQAAAHFPWRVRGKNLAVWHCTQYLAGKLRRRHQSVSLDDLMERYITDDALTETTAARQKLRRVQALLQQKDERTRSVVYLRAQGYSYQEIAQKLQITEASARVVEHRTRAWLKATLQKEGYDE